MHKLDIAVVWPLLSERNLWDRDCEFVVRITNSLIDDVPSSQVCKSALCRQAGRLSCRNETSARFALLRLQRRTNTSVALTEATSVHMSGCVSLGLSAWKLCCFACVYTSQVQHCVFFNQTHNSSYCCFICRSKHPLFSVVPLKLDDMKQLMNILIEFVIWTTDYYLNNHKVVCYESDMNWSYRWYLWYFIPHTRLRPRVEVHILRTPCWYLLAIK